MIQLKKMNGDVFTLNAVLIEQIESLPDTTITLINGKKMLVKNSNQEVRDLAIKFYQKIGLQQINHQQVGEENE
ncbi:flagellar FlbD family protein [Oceanobacillus sp. CAU 1775]